MNYSQQIKDLELSDGIQSYPICPHKTFEDSWHFALCRSLILPAIWFTRTSCISVKKKKKKKHTPIVINNEENFCNPVFLTHNII